MNLICLSLFELPFYIQFSKERGFWDSLNVNGKGEYELLAWPKEVSALQGAMLMLIKLNFFIYQASRGS